MTVFYMLAPKSNFPFTGGFFARVSIGGFWVAGCGYIARETGVRKAFLPARHVQHAIEVTGKKNPKEIWVFVKEEKFWKIYGKGLSLSPQKNLGRKRGSDISIILATGDLEGVHVCASGFWNMGQSDPMRNGICFHNDIPCFKWMGLSVIFLVHCALHHQK